MALYGVGLDVTVKKIHMDLKLHIAKKVGASLKNLQNIFNQMDKNGNHKLELKEFEKGLAAFGFFPKKVDLQALLKYYDKNGDGAIDFDEFLTAIRYNFY
jgi:Ca2+-binding protein (EF-Hand superfamily)